jgi:hypothetical protein
MLQSLESPNVSHPVKRYILQLLTLARERDKQNEAPADPLLDNLPEMEQFRP